MLDIYPTVSATSTVLTLVEHDLPEHELLTLLDLRRENLEIVEFVVEAGTAAAGRAVKDLGLPAQARLIWISRDEGSEIAQGDTQLRPGDQVIAILAPSAEPALRRLLG